MEASLDWTLLQPQEDLTTMLEYYLNADEGVWSSNHVMPATNIVSERSFSALKQVKTYLRSTTGDSRLNHLMMLHVHKDRTDALTLVDVANDFVGEKENRKQLFGKFSANDIPNKFSISSKSTQTEN